MDAFSAARRLSDLKRRQVVEHHMRAVQPTPGFSFRHEDFIGKLLDSESLGSSGETIFGPNELPNQRLVEFSGGLELLVDGATQVRDERVFASVCEVAYSLVASGFDQSKDSSGIRAHLLQSADSL